MNMNKLDYAAIPSATMASLTRWVRYANMPRPFVWAVVRNNLSRAIETADLDDLETLIPLVSFVHDCLPSKSKGDWKTILAWTGDPKWDPQDYIQR